jgi:hypothetical protein
MIRPHITTAIITRPAIKSLKKFRQLGEIDRMRVSKLRRRPTFGGG